MLPQSTGLYSMGATLLKLDHPSLWHERKTPSASRGRKKACTALSPDAFSTTADVTF